MAVISSFTELHVETRKVGKTYSLSFHVDDRDIGILMALAVKYRFESFSVDREGDLLKVKIVLDNVAYEYDAGRFWGFAALVKNHIG